MNPSTTPTIRRRPLQSHRSRHGLVAHAKNITSQNGEDGIISRLFELLPYQERRVCVDVGAWDGRHLSNTYTLLVDETNCRDHSNDSIRKSKWSGVLIEADQQRFEELKSLHEPLGNTCICANVSCQPDSSSLLSAILKRDAKHLEQDFDFLSIDVDGCDYWLLHDVLGCDQDSDDNLTIGESATCTNSTQPQFYRPKVICIEFNPTMPTDLIYIQPRNDSIRHGSSLSALVELANSCGYVLVETTIFNAFFVQRTIYEQYLQKEVPDTSIEALHEPSMGTTLYQLYDGTIKLWGCKRMLWHRMPMDEKMMQMLPVEERQFPFAPSEDDGGDGVEDDRIRQRAVDMSAYCKSQNYTDNSAISDAKRECFLKLNNTLQTDGFALVTGTGVSSTLCNNALKAAKAFLHEADESVRRSCLTKDRARRGYSPSCTENFASLIGQRGPNDLVKKFRIGPEEEENDESNEITQNKLSSLHQPNSWPSEEIWDKSRRFKSVIEEYYNELRKAADCILYAICDGIVAENANFEESMRVITDAHIGSEGTAADGREERSKVANHTSILTLLGYQTGSRHKKGSKGYMNPLVAAHTDVGMITVLLFDNGKCASLQRAADAQQSGVGGNCSSNNQEWIDVNLPSKNYLENDQDPVFIVNVGDCLSELTGGCLRSTLHRVVPRQCDKFNASQDVNRTSLALFVGLQQSAQLILPGGDVMTYEEWRRRWIAKALDVLKKNDYANN
jgi:isopenicillin N synthase-like dioxygenase